MDKLQRPEGPIAGVCEGLGNYCGLDPVVFRIIFLISFLAGCGGVFIYMLAWLLIPREI